MPYMLDDDGFAERIRLETIAIVERDAKQVAELATALNSLLREIEGDRDEQDKKSANS